MTKKATLSAWASRLGADLPAEPTAAQLEAGIDSAIATLTNPPEPEPQYSLADGIRNNWAVIRSELPDVAREIASNLLGRNRDDGVYLLFEESEESVRVP